jgi:hypothetical protein
MSQSEKGPDEGKRKKARSRTIPPLPVSNGLPQFEALIVIVVLPNTRVFYKSEYVILA